MAKVLDYPSPSLREFRILPGYRHPACEMEGSAKASNHRRYAQLKELFFEEGIMGYVPHLGSIYDKLRVELG